ILAEGRGRGNAPAVAYDDLAEAGNHYEPRKGEAQGSLDLVGRYVFLHKPFDACEIKQLALALIEKWNLRKTIKKKTEELKLAHTTTIRALAELAELRDTDTGNHLKRVSQYSKLIARKLGERRELKWCNYVTEQYVMDIGESSVLHDIGKVGIPDTILLKPDKLTIEEFELMKTHTTIGGDTLTRADKEVGIRSFLTLGKEVAYYHHEKFDGTGYPRGLRGESIPLSARIVALADVYDALTSQRPYRKELSHDTAFHIITKEMGNTHFDPVILEIFCCYEQEFNKIHLQYP
ncbi:MAG: HD-GYP domain-containing protein, partial [bacterium]